MQPSRYNRRKFIRSATAATSAAGLLSMLPGSLLANTTHQKKPMEDKTTNTKADPKINFSGAGINHSHINSQVEAVMRGGGQFISFYAKEDDLASAFSKKYPQAKRVTDEK